MQVLSVEHDPIQGYARRVLVSSEGVDPVLFNFKFVAYGPFSAPSWEVDWVMVDDTFHPALLRAAEQAALAAILGL